MNPPSADPSPPPAPSLGDAIAARLRALRRPALPPGWWWGVWSGAVAGLAAAALLATLAAARLEGEAARLGPATAAADRSRAELAGFARAAARPSLGGRLDTVAAHLPAGADPLAVAIEASGRSVLEVAVADPDALRTLRIRDPWFAGWREQAQTRADDGRLRVTLVEDAR